MRGATEILELIQQHYEISTHAPRAGCDEVLLDQTQANTVFQPTHPVRGATH